MALPASALRVGLALSPLLTEASARSLSPEAKQLSDMFEEEEEEEAEYLSRVQMKRLCVGEVEHILCLIALAELPILALARTCISFPIMT